MGAHTIRDARMEDLPEIVGIYNSTIPSRMVTADTSPVTLETRVPWFDRHSPGRYPLTILELDGSVVAWLSFQPFRDRPAFEHTAEISLYVHKDFRSKGYGHILLSDALRRAPRVGLHNLIACIFSHNTPSCTIFTKFGFKVWGELPQVAAIGKSEFGLTILGRRIAPYTVSS